MQMFLLNVVKLITSKINVGKKKIIPHESEIFQFHFRSFFFFHSDISIATFKLQYIGIEQYQA